MDKKTNNINWPEIMSKFAEHKGRIIDFCKDNNINHHQLYHQRKKLKKIESQNFHAIDMTNTIDLKSPEDLQQSIKIEIGNAKIFIPIEDKSTLLFLVKELAEL